MTDAERVRALRDIMGAHDAALQVFPDAIRKLTFANHDRWVKPLYEQHWPDALANGSRTARKLRIVSHHDDRRAATIDVIE
jgi:hypothetical protein